MQNQLKNEIRAIISGKSQVRHGTAIQAASSHLGNGTSTSPKSQISKQVREQEIRSLRFAILKSCIRIDNQDPQKNSD